MTSGAEIDPSECTRDELYRIATTSVVPRPIGWISTTSEDGVDNLAPYSYFNVVASSPIVLMFSARIREERKDTPRNVLVTEEFVANVVTEPVAKAMNDSATIVDQEVNEFERFGIEREPSQTVSPPRVADSPVHFECKLRESLRVHDYDVLLGEVRHIHVADRVLTDGVIDAEKLDAVGRIGNSGFTTIQRMDMESTHK